MNTRTRRGIAVGSSFALVGAIVVGGFALASNVASATPEPSTRPAVEISSPSAPTDLELEQRAADAAAAEAARVEAERVAAEAAAAEAARIEAERVAAEQAAADQAARDAAARQAPAAPSAPQAPAAPAAPAPAPPAGGDQQAGECREYNDANECTAWYTP